MNTRNRIRNLVTEDKNLLLSKTFFVLPDNPSNKNFSPSQIKKRGYEGYLVLFEFINDIIDAINANVDLTNADVTAINTAIDTINSYFSSGKALKAIADEDGSNIKATYETKTDATTKFNTNKAEIDKIKNGTVVAKKAECDEDGTNIKTYGKSLSHGLTGNDTQWTLVISLLDKLGNVLDTETQVFGSATTTNAGLLSASDKVKINNIAGDIATALAQAKAYADDLVLRTNLVSILGEASQSLNGLLSAEDKRRLDVLYSLLGESADVDTVVNTISEVLAIFAQYPEGVTVVSALADKINFDDIVDNLESYNSLKVLSANQGRIIKGLIDNIVNGTTVVKKAQQDKNGNDIDTTYYSKSEYFPVMAVSISEPDPITGEVTIDYPAGMTLSFNDTTGEVTFSW